MRRHGLGYGLIVLALLSGGCAKSPPIPIAVLYSEQSPQLKAALPASACTYFTIEDAPFPDREASTVIVAGHSLPPDYLGKPAAFVAATIAGFHPRLIVMDTCYGASTPILAALAADGCRARIVAPPFPIPETGLIYDAAFTDTRSAQARSRMVHTQPGFALLRWTISSKPLAELETRIDQESSESLRKDLLLNDPPLVRTNLSEPPSSTTPVLAFVPVARFKEPTAPTQ